MIFFPPFETWFDWKKILKVFGGQKSKKSKQKKDKKKNINTNFIVWIGLLGVHIIYLHNVIIIIKQQTM